MMKFKSSSSRLAILTIEVLLALIFLLTFIVNKGYLTLSARTGPPFPDVKVYSTATIDDAFADNTVLLTLNGAASKNLRTYTIEDFPELELLDVIDLTAPTVELAKKQIIAEGTKTWGELQNHIDSQMLIKLDEFRQILCLTLQEVGKENVLKAIKKLESREDVLAAEPNYRVQGLATPHPTLYDAESQWGLNNASHGIQAQEAWNITTGTNTVIVGIIDSGIDATHPDLVNRLHQGNPHNINTTLHRDYIDGNPGNNFAIVNPVDQNGHGSHCGGVVSAQWNNANSISGVAWNVRLVSLRVLDANGSGFVADIVSAVAFASGAGIRILNLSLGGGAYTVAQQTTLRNYPGLMVCAAGNENSNINLTGHTTDPGTPTFPASFAFDNIISVGATAIDLTLTPSVERRALPTDWNSVAGGSNWGSTSVHLFAPGTNILSTFPVAICQNERIFLDGTRLCEFGTENREFLESLIPSIVPSWNYLIQNFDLIFGRPPADFASSTHNVNGYHFMNGTSMAAPHVAGVAALMLSINPSLTIAQIKAIINNNVDIVTNLNDLCQTGGRLNAFKAVSAVAFSTTTTSGGISISGFISGYTMPQNTSISLPERFSRQDSSTQQNLVAIGASAFTNQTKLIKIIIPSSVNYIGSNAFKNTNNASIYLEGKTSVPNTFNAKWNISNNPVYLNGVKCLHNGTKTRVPLDSTHHADLCDKCRTATNITKHDFYTSNCTQKCYGCSYQGIPNHDYTYTPIPVIYPYEMKQHYADCNNCGDRSILPCLGILQNPDEDVYCLLCGRLMTTPFPMYMIEMPNGDILISSKKIQYEYFLLIAEKFNYKDVSYSYFEKNNKLMLNYDKNLNVDELYLIPKMYEFEEYING